MEKYERIKYLLEYLYALRACELNGILVDQKSIVGVINELNEALGINLAPNEEKN